MAVLQTHCIRVHNTQFSSRLQTSNNCIGR